MNVVKSKYRTLLRSDTLDSALFNKFNLPEEHEAHMEPIVKAWKDNKRVGVHKEGWEEPSSVVAPLFKKTTRH